MVSPSNGRQRLRFGLFEADLASGELYKHGRLIHVQEKPFRILAMLLERPGEVVSREEVQKKLWPDGTFVDFDESLDTALKKLRQALGDSPQNPIFVETIPRRGYRFIAPVEPPRVAISPHIDTPQSVAAAPRKIKSTTRRVLTASATCAGLVLMFSIALLLRPAAPVPHVKRIRQITNVGTVLGNQNLVVAGSRLYFTVGEKGEFQVRCFSLDSNTISEVESPFPGTELHDISPSGSELLIGRFEQGIPAQWARSLWRLPLPSGTPVRVGGLLADDAVWTPHGDAIAYASEADQSLNLTDVNGTQSRKIANLPGRPFKPRFSPDGRVIRISVLDTKTGGVSLWQVDASGKNLKRVLPRWSDSSRAWAGRWTPDGRYFLFAGSQEGPRNIWALRVKRDILHKAGDLPVQLTDGLINYTLVALSSDAKTIYAAGGQRRGQLMRYDLRSHQFQSYANGLSGDQVCFSPDRKRMAYIAYPEGTLVTSHVDGSEQLQLTFAPMRAFKPQWSPDGTQIALVAASAPDKPTRIYLVPARGGAARLLAPGIGKEQDSPEWSNDGHSLLFSSSDESERWTLHLFDLETNRDAVLPGSLGLSYGRISPDGRFIAASSSNSTNSGLVLYETGSHTIRQLAQVADYPAWSANGKYVYYNNLMQGAYVGPERLGIYRVAVADGKIERLAPTPNFPLAGNFGVWTGLAPDGSVLLLREVGSSDIYALEVDFP